jgi:hypothetical protein
LIKREIKDLITLAVSEAKKTFTDAIAKKTPMALTVSEVKEQFTEATASIDNGSTVDSLVSDELEKRFTTVGVLFDVLDIVNTFPDARMLCMDQVKLSKNKLPGKEIDDKELKHYVLELRKIFEILQNVVFSSSSKFNSFFKRWKRVIEDTSNISRANYMIFIALVSLAIKNEISKKFSEKLSYLSKMTTSSAILDPTTTMETKEKGVKDVVHKENTPVTDSVKLAVTSNAKDAGAEEKDIAINGRGTGFEEEEKTDEEDPTMKYEEIIKKVIKEFGGEDEEFDEDKEYLLDCFRKSAFINGDCLKWIQYDIIDMLFKVRKTYSNITVEEQNRKAPLIVEAILHFIDLSEKLQLILKDEGKYVDLKYQPREVSDLFDIFMNKNFYSGSLHNVDQAKKIITDISQIDRFPESNSTKSLHALKNAWVHADKYDYFAKLYKKVSNITYILLLSLGIATTFFSILGAEGYDTQIEVICFGFASTVLIGFIAFTNPALRWQQLRTAHLSIVSEIFKFRCRIGEYRFDTQISEEVIDQKLYESIRDIKQGLLDSTDLNKTAFFYFSDDWYEKHIKIASTKTHDEKSTSKAAEQTANSDVENPPQSSTNSNFNLGITSHQTVSQYKLMKNNNRCDVSLKRIQEAKDILMISNTDTNDYSITKTIGSDDMKAYMKDMNVRLFEKVFQRNYVPLFFLLRPYCKVDIEIVDEKRTKIVLQSLLEERNDLKHGYLISDKINLLKINFGTIYFLS